MKSKRKELQNISAAVFLGQGSLRKAAAKSKNVPAPKSHRTYRSFTAQAREGLDEYAATVPESRATLIHVMAKDNFQYTESLPSWQQSRIRGTVNDWALTYYTEPYRSSTFRLWIRNLTCRPGDSHDKPSKGQKKSA